MATVATGIHRYWREGIAYLLFSEYWIPDHVDPDLLNINKEAVDRCAIRFESLSIGLTPRFDYFPKGANRK